MKHYRKIKELTTLGKIYACRRKVVPQRFIGNIQVKVIYFKGSFMRYQRAIEMTEKEDSLHRMYNQAGGHLELGPIRTPRKWHRIKISVVQMTT